ncbi:MAG: hypothetical protein ACREPX_04855 [Rhodanobacteraceae bacterium]
MIAVGECQGEVTPRNQLISAGIEIRNPSTAAALRSVNERDIIFDLSFPTEPRLPTIHIKREPESQNPVGRKYLNQKAVTALRGIEPGT